MGIVVKDDLRLDMSKGIPLLTLSPSSARRKASMRSEPIATTRSANDLTIKKRTCGTHGSEPIEKNEFFYTISRPSGDTRVAMAQNTAPQTVTQDSRRWRACPTFLAPQA